MQYNISLLVGLKNNLEYNKHFYTTTRALYPEVEICFVSYGSTDKTHKWLDSLEDINVKYYYSDETKTFSETFNKAAELATKEYVAYLHNDTVLAPNFLENIAKHLKKERVVSYTTIEPPIFAGHERPGKIIHDLGSSLETFNIGKLYSFVESRQVEDLDKLEQGVTFFMCLSKETLLGIGGMDKLYNPMFCEDDDLIRRLSLKGLELFTSLDAICYHFVSKTSRFSEEYQNRTQIIEYNSNKNFIRKWGSRSQAPKYDIGYIVKACNSNLLEALEPWCDTMYIEDDMEVLTTHYLNKEQKNTSYNLVEKIKPYDNEKNNNILVEFDGRKFTNADFAFLQRLPEIIKDNGDVGQFEFDIFKITINSMTEYQDELVVCKK